MFKADDRVRETSTTTGVGTYTLAGAPTGYQSFSSLGVNNYCPYFATDDTNWETGIGRYISGPDRLERTHIFASSNADAAVNWGATTKKIRCGLPASFAFPKVQTVDVAGGAGTQVLTQLQQRCDILILNGALTGNRVAEVDDTPWKWSAVVNQTTGNFTLNFKTSAGASQVELFQGRGISVALDGTTMYKTAEDTPPGTFEDFGGGTVQAGRLACDGSNVSRTGVTAALFNKIGTTHGVGDGSTTFTLPDRRRRVTVGSGGTGTAQLANTVGATGGAESRAIAQGNLPAVGIGVSVSVSGSISGTAAAQSIHGTTSGSGGHVTGVRIDSDLGGASAVAGYMYASGVSGSFSGSGSGSTSALGSGTAFDEMQPSLVVLATIRI